MNRINTKEELYWDLEKYKGILSDHIIEYLKSLIELDFSVIREYISNNDRESLCELDIYKRISMYNIFNRTIELLSNNDISININNSNNILVINNNTYDKRIDIFKYDYNKAFINDKKLIDSGYRTNIIGEIHLYKLVKNYDMIKVELDRVMKKLEILYDAKNPYANPKGIYEGLSEKWMQQHKERISYYEKLFIELDNYKNSRTNIIKEMELCNYLNDLLLKDFGLSNKDFYDENKLFSRNESELNKKRVKKLSNIVINNNIRYI